MHYIKRCKPETYLVPCYDFGLIWHSHQQHVLIYQSEMKKIYGSISFQEDSSLDFHLCTYKKKEITYLWEKHLGKYEVKGGMFRGEPLLPNLDYDSDYFSRLITNKWISSLNIMELSLSNVPTNYGFSHDIVIVNIAVTENGCVIYEYSKSYEAIDGTINIAFCRGQNAFQIDSRFKYEVSIHCTYSSTNKVYFGKIIPVKESPTFAQHKVFLKCQSNTSITCIMSTKMDNYILKSDALFKMDFSQTFNRSSLSEAIKSFKTYFPKSYFCSGYFCEYCENELNPIGENLLKLKWRFVHSKHPSLSVIELYDYSGRVIATSHTVNSFSLPSGKQISDSTKCFSYNPATERAMLIRGIKGDWAFIKSDIFYGDRRQTLHMQLFILNGKESRFIDIEKNYLLFKCGIANGTVLVNLSSQNITLSEGLADIPECLCIGLSILVLYNFFSKF